MRCPSCNRRISSESRFCNYCGQETGQQVSGTSVPEGFVYDKISGWYHKIELNRDKGGKLVQQVTYYNPEENWFLTELPLEHPSYGESAGEGPIGDASEYLYDEVQELYYLTDVQFDPKYKEVIQRVSYFYPKEKTFTNINYLIMDAGSSKDGPEKKPSDTGVEGKGKGGSKLPASTVSSSLLSQRTLLLRSVALFLGFLTIVMGTYYSLIWADVVPDGYLSAVAANFSWSNMKNISSTGHWPDYPYVATSYKGAHQDSEFLYFLSDDPETGKNTALYRYTLINGEEPEFQAVIESPNSENQLTSFAVTDQAIYYSLTKKNSADARYYRLNKTSGEFQFLFEGDNSAIIAKEGFVYLLCPSNNRVRILSDETGNPKAYKEQDIPVEYGYYLLSHNFSVQGNTLYYAQVRGNSYKYASFQLETLETEELLANESEDKVYNPFWQGNKAYYLVETGEDIALMEQDKESRQLFIYPAPENAPYFTVKQGNQIFYTSYDGTYKTDLKKAKEPEQITKEIATAATQDWLVFSSAVYSIKTEELIPIKGITTQGQTYAKDTALEDDSVADFADTAMLDLSEEGFLMAVLAAYREDTEPIVLGQSGVLTEFGAFLSFLDDSQRSAFLQENRLEATSEHYTTDILWELLSEDIYTLEGLVKQGLVPGLKYQEDAIYFDPEWSPLVEKEAIQLLEEKEKEDDTFSRVYSVTVGDTVKTYQVTYKENEMYLLTKYKILSVKSLKD